MLAREYNTSYESDHFTCRLWDAHAAAGLEPAESIVKMCEKTVAGHLLDVVQDITTEEVIFIVVYKGKQAESRSLHMEFSLL